MKYVLDGQDIGMFAPSDLEQMQIAYMRLCSEMGISGDVEDARKLARSLIQLYRHGVREPEQLFSALSRRPAA